MHARVPARELYERITNVTVIDVRSPAEYESVHIKGSFNLPLDRLPEHVQDVGMSVKSPVVLVCRSGQRAEQAERALLAADLPGLHVLDGGLSAWEGAGLPVVRGKQRWSVDRQVRGLAAGIILASIAGSFVVPWLSLVAAGVAGGLMHSAVTNSCLMANFLSRLPYNRGAGCDVAKVIREMGDGRTAVSSAGAS